MSPPPVDSYRLRLLVALAVLKCKPANQTCFAYIQSLRSIFPANQSAGNENESSWKHRALKLEKECETLKQSLETTQLQSFLHNNKDATEPQASSASSQKTEAPTNASTGKKKAKQKQMDNPRDDPIGNSFDLKTLLKRLDNGKASKKATHSARLFEALDTFFALLGLHGREDFPAKAFVSTTCRAIDALSISLDHTVKKAMDLDRLRTLDTLLRLIIGKSFPIIATCSRGLRLPLDSDPWTTVLNQLSTAILVPLIRSFFLLSKRNLECLLQDDKIRSKSSIDRTGTKHVDGRPALLALFHGTVTLIQSTLLSLAQPHLATANGTKKSARTRGGDQHKNSLAELSLVHHSLILESIRHLNQILSGEPTKAFGSAKGRRVLRVVIKDTLWYLCSVLHIVINLNAELHAPCLPDVIAYNKGPCNLSANIHRLRLLKKTVLDCFVGLLMRQDRARRQDMTLDMPIMAEHTSTPGNRECRDSGGLHGARLEMDDQDGGHRVKAATLVGAGDVDADASGRSIQADESGTSHLTSDRGFVSGGGGSVNNVHSLPCTQTDRTHVVLDDMEHGMLLRVVESFFNMP